MRDMRLDESWTGRIWDRHSGIKRFPGYVKNGVHHILLPFKNKLLMSIIFISRPQHMNTL